MEAFTIAEIERLAQLVGKGKLQKLEVQAGDIRLCLTAHPDCPLPAAEPPAEDGILVTAPLVGTYYSAPSPDAPPFLTVGQTVKKGDVLMLIESMKLMNEVVSEHDGVVREIYVKNGAPVEYGQKLLKLSTEV